MFHLSLEKVIFLPPNIMNLIILILAFFHKFSAADIKITPIIRAIEQDQFNAVSQELAALESECTDVEQAAAKLRQSLGRMKRDGRQRLKDTLHTVNHAFAEYFTYLFKGGKAQLNLVGDDPLEAGLEVLAMPPGKKLTNLQLLSGGEQTLTALALIFAAFQANPSPVCVLDEVDAPLDETNVVRFVHLVRRLCDLMGTRFLIVTHHGVTMSKMDRLYGVTMAKTDN